MRKVILLAKLVILFQSCKGRENVYISTDLTAECYHKSENCIGLRNCGSDAKIVTIYMANKNGRRPCELCRVD